MIHSQKNVDPLSFSLPFSVPDSRTERVRKVHKTLTPFPEMVQGNREGRRSAWVAPGRPVPALHGLYPLPVALGSWQAGDGNLSRPSGEAIRWLARARVRPAPAECGSGRVTATVGRRGHGLGRRGRRRPPSRLQSGRSAGRLRRAPPHFAGQAGRAGGASPRAPRALADRTHPASLTPTPTPGARTEGDKAAAQRGRRTALHLSPGAGSGGRAPGGGAGGAERGVVRSAATNRSAASGRPGRGAGLWAGRDSRGRGAAALRVASLTSLCDFQPCRPGPSYGPLVLEGRGSLPLPPGPAALVASGPE